MIRRRPIFVDRSSPVATARMIALKLVTLQRRLRRD